MTCVCEIEDTSMCISLRKHVGNSLTIGILNITI